MKVLFVKNETECMGIECLSSYLKLRGHSVNLVFDPLLFASPLYFRNATLSKLLDLKNVVIERILRHNPDIVAFSVLSYEYAWACSIAAAIKRKKNTPIIFGGMHPTSLPEEVIKMPFIDYVCIGEGEEAFADLLDCLEHGKDDRHIKNICLKSRNRIIINEPRNLIEDLDTLPFPDKDIFYNLDGKNEQYLILTGRGCIYRCTYCFNSILKDMYRNKGKYIRRRSPDNVIRELLQAKNKYNLKSINFFDDIFTYDIGWLREFAHKYKEHIGLPYSCFSHPLHINAAIVDLLEYSGCSWVTMGIQTANEEIRKNLLLRNESNRDIEKAVALFKKSKIFFTTNFILGLPGEGEKELLATLDFCFRHKSDYPALFDLKYYPRIPIIPQAKKLGYLTDEEIRNIENAQDYYAILARINSHNKRTNKILILFALNMLPFTKPLMRFLIKNNRFRFLPDITRFTVAILITSFLFKKIIYGKKEPCYTKTLPTVLNFYFVHLKDALVQKIFNYSPFRFLARKKRRADVP
jgi:radical SAM superfamily enzyme YgiQ (UPF0313 family)